MLDIDKIFLTSIMRNVTINNRRKTYGRNKKAKI